LISRFGPSFRPTPPVGMASDPFSPYAGAGLGRPSISRKIAWHNSFGTATSLVTRGDLEADSGGNHPCARAYATIRRASAAGTIFPLSAALIRTCSQIAVEILIFRQTLADEAACRLYGIGAE
jgi:hypothetical protein